MRLMQVSLVAGFLFAGSAAFAQTPGQTATDAQNQNIQPQVQNGQMNGNGFNNPGMLPPGASAYPETHIEAPGQGAQDPARSEFLEGWSRDMPRCMNTLLARRESRQEAQEVCNKILTDLGD